MKHWLHYQLIFTENSENTIAADYFSVVRHEVNSMLILYEAA